MLVLSIISVNAQKVEIYNPKANAKEDIAKAAEKASFEGKHVFSLNNSNRGNCTLIR
ncbi:MAG: hypothetical protein L3J11_08385 [Draconibacterium sp.]|nr:hypothetical protein [Draconibacterium sp.]